VAAAATLTWAFATRTSRERLTRMGAVELSPFYLRGRECADDLLQLARLHGDLRGQFRALAAVNRIPATTRSMEWPTERSGWSCVALWKQGRTGGHEEFGPRAGLAFDVSAMARRPSHGLRLAFDATLFGQLRDHAFNNPR